MPLLSGGVYFRRKGGALLSGFNRRAKKINVTFGVGDGVLRSVIASAHSEAYRNI